MLINILFYTMVILAIIYLCYGIYSQHLQNEKIIHMSKQIDEAIKREQ